MTCGASSRAAFALCAILVSVQVAAAQNVSRDPSAAEVALSLRSRNDPGAALSVLTQARGPQTRKRMDDIADSLAAIAIGFPGTDQRGVSTRATAQAVLLQAGLGMSGVKGIDRATPYAGAADRLMRIVETSEDIGVRGSSLSALTQLPANAGVLPFLRKVATSQNRVAYLAVMMLGKETGPDGLAIAHELYRSGNVTQPTARQTLDRVAVFYKWH